MEPELELDTKHAPPDRPPVRAGPRAADGDGASPVHADALAESADLVERLKAGEEPALKELYDLHSPVIYGLALRMLGEPADAEELVVDILVKAWSSIDSFDDTRGTLEAWLLTMTRSRALDRLRRRRRREAAMEVASAGVDLLRDTNGCRAGPTVEHFGRRRQLHALLDVLPDDQRVAIELAYFGGMTQREIASAVDAPLGTVKTRIRTALKRLCAHTNGNGEEEA